MPSITVTFLFTDVEASTKPWERYPHAMQAAIARHDEILREVMDSSGGFVFKTVGDAFCVAFSSAPYALEAASWRNGRFSQRNGRTPCPCGYGWRCTLDPPKRGTATTLARLPGAGRRSRARPDRTRPAGVLGAPGVRARQHECGSILVAGESARDGPKPGRDVGTFLGNTL
jgi:class 3 adenylate cyclase